MTLVSYGSFPAGNLSEFDDSSANGGGTAGYGSIVSASDWVAGKYKAKLRANSSVSPIYYGDATNVRIHLLGSAAISAMLVSGTTVYRPLSLRWTGGTPLGIYAGDEIHASGAYALANGPAPGNGFGIDVQGGVPKKLWRVRGGADPNNSSFNQWTFGASPQSDDNGGNRQSQPWVGLTDVVTNDEWIHTMAIMLMHPSNGWFELWATPHGGQMVNVVPRKTAIGTMYAPPITHYPMISMYYNRAAGGDHTIEVAAGAYATTLAEAKAHQVAQVGYDPWSGVTPPPAPVKRNHGNPDFDVLASRPPRSRR